MCVCAGKDASRAFITGDFTESGLSSDVSDFSDSQIVALYDWLSFYQRDYTPVGGYHTMMPLICYNSTTNKELGSLYLPACIRFWNK